MNASKNVVSKPRQCPTTNKMTAINNIICPDGRRRQMYIHPTSKTDGKTIIGYVKAWDADAKKQVSVAGYAKREGRGYRFFPHMDGMNIHVVRPASYAPGTRVKISDGVTGIITAVQWNYMTPEYTILPDTIVLEEGDFEVDSDSTPA